MIFTSKCVKLERLFGFTLVLQNYANVLRPARQGSFALASSTIDNGGGGVIIPSPASVPSFSPVVVVVFVVVFVFVVFDVVVASTTGDAIVMMRGISGV